MKLQLNATSNLESTYLFPEADGPPCNFRNRVLYECHTTLKCRYESYDKPGSIILSSSANSYLREHNNKYPHFAPTVKPPMSYDYTIGEDDVDGFSFGGGRNDISEEFTSAFYSPITYDYTIGEEFGPQLPPKRRRPTPPQQQQPSRGPSSSPRPPLEHQVKKPQIPCDSNSK